jgi:hypothetical protein
MIQVAYTNSNCSDLWEIFQKQTIKHCKIPLFLISDKEPKNFGYTDLYIYNNNEPYYKVWIDALKKFNSEYFIYLQEDFFIYDDVNQKKLYEYLEFLKSNKEYSFIRLLKSGNLKNKKIKDTLYEIESTNQNIFSMQSTIWRTEDYVKLLDYVKDSKWFENENYGKAAITLNIKGLYHYNDEPKRGGAHYDTDVYPYIATALVKGKWNLNEYENELTPILNDYKIKIEERGIY